MQQPQKAKKQKAKVIYRYVGDSTLWHHLAGHSTGMLYNICYHFDNTAMLSIFRFDNGSTLNIFQRIFIHLSCDLNSQKKEAGSTQNMMDFAKKMSGVTKRQVNSRFMFRTHDALKYAAGHLMDFTWYRNTLRPYFVDRDDGSDFLENAIPRSITGKKAKIKWMGDLD